MAFIQRTGQDTILRSDRLPTVAIHVDPAFKYAGSTSFILYEIARAEQHHFVVVDSERRVERLLWFQFEGYLENNDRRYRYPPMETMSLNGFTFLHDAGVLNIDEDYRERPTSDSAHVVDFLRDKGYTFGGDTMFKRLVWLDSDLRNELMIIYAENMGTAGSPTATESSRLVQALQERSLSSFKIL